MYLHSARSGRTLGPKSGGRTSRESWSIAKTVERHVSQAFSEGRYALTQELAGRFADGTDRPPVGDTGE
jgi:hypothetical protein